MTEEQEKQESQKTLVAFVAGLLIGGLLVWIFGGTPQTDKHDDTMDEAQDSEMVSDTESDMPNEDEAASSDAEAAVSTATSMEVGEGMLEVANQAAGRVVTLDSATFPTSDGWVGVRTYTNGQIGSILGAARYSESQGLIPTEVELLAPTVAGRTYAVTFFTEDGDRKFNPAYDVQIDGELTTFVAQ